MPELPEVESARSVLERTLNRRIVDVDDSDGYVCRPYQQGQIRAALLGNELLAAHRRGKSIWCDLSPGTVSLGVHLGMSGKLVVSSPDGTEVDGGTTGRAAESRVTTAGRAFRSPSPTAVG